MFRSLLFSILLILSLSVHSQSSLRCDVFGSFVKQDMASWESAVQKYAAGDGLSHEYILSLYGFVGFLYLNGAHAKAAEYNRVFESQIESFGQSSSDKAFVYSMLGACHGYKVVLNSPVSSMYNLYKCLSYVGDAVKADSLSPYGWAETGNVKFQTAILLGGDFNKIASYYRSSIAIFEQSGQDLRCNWYYINSLLFYAKCFEESKQPAEAINVYKKILRIAPDYEGAKRWMIKQQNLLATPSR